MKKRILFIIMVILMFSIVYAAPTEFFIHGVVRNSTNNSLIEATQNIYINFTNSSTGRLIYEQTQNNQHIDDGVYHTTFTGITDTIRRNFFSSVDFILKIGTDVFSKQSITPNLISHAAFLANNSLYLDGVQASSYSTDAERLATNTSMKLYVEVANTSMKDYVDNSATLDTNETTRVDSFANITIQEVADNIGNYTNTKTSIRQSIINNATGINATVKEHFASSTNITFDSTTGTFWISMPISQGSVFIPTGLYNFSKELLYYNNLTKCADGQILKMSGTDWVCGSDNTGGAGGEPVNITTQFAGDVSGTYNAIVIDWTDMDNGTIVRDNELVDNNNSILNFCSAITEGVVNLTLQDIANNMGNFSKDKEDMNQSIVSYVDDNELDTNRTDEEITDLAGGMWTGNTETRATVTFQDGDNTIDIVVDDMNDDQPDNDAEVPDDITINSNQASYFHNTVNMTNITFGPMGIWYNGSGICIGSC
jgi:hypothetical protein